MIDKNKIIKRIERIRWNCAKKHLNFWSYTFIDNLANWHIKEITPLISELRRMQSLAGEEDFEIIENLLKGYLKWE